MLLWVELKAASFSYTCGADYTIIFNRLERFDFVSLLILETNNPETDTHSKLLSCEERKNGVLAQVQVPVTWTHPFLSRCRKSLVISSSIVVKHDDNGQ